MTFDDCKQGMRVFHTSRNDSGTVTEIKDGIVTVLFDKPLERSINKAFFDRGWFEACGHFLRPASTGSGGAG